jgi:hypothetical protein
MTGAVCLHRPRTQTVSGQFLGRECAVGAVTRGHCRLSNCGKALGCGGILVVRKNEADDAEDAVRQKSIAA